MAMWNVNAIEKTMTNSARARKERKECCIMLRGAQARIVMEARLSLVSSRYSSDLYSINTIGITNFSGIPVELCVNAAKLGKFFRRIRGHSLEPC